MSYKLTAADALALLDAMELDDWLPPGNKWPPCRSDARLQMAERLRLIVNLLIEDETP